MNAKRIGFVALAVVGLLAALWFAPRPAPREAPTQSDARRSEAQVTPAAELEVGIADAVVPARVGVPGEATAPPAQPVKPATELLPFRGRVLDVVTGQPVAAALAVCGALEAVTDAGGRFASSATLPPDFEGFDFHSLGRSSHIRSVARSNLEWIDEKSGWLARIRIGPTYRFRVVGAPESASDRWRARVVAQQSGTTDKSWSWIDAVPDDPPWIRYDNPLAHDDKARLRLEVENFEGTLRGSVDVSTTIGIHPGILLVEIERELAGITGRVVDENDRPRNKATVFAIPRTNGIANADAWPSASTDGEGRYFLRALTPGPYWLQACPRRGEDPRTIAFDASTGENTAPDIVIPAERLVGAIEGLLKSSDASYPKAVVRLRAVDGRNYDRFDVVDPKVQLLVESQHRALLRDAHMRLEPVGFFEFQQVPEGEYEITVSSGDGRRWTPTPLRVRPPKQDLEIFRDDASMTWQPRFDVRDAASGEPVVIDQGQTVTVQFALDEYWMRDLYPVVWFDRRVDEPRFADGTRLRWLVHAEGYALAHGTEADFVGSGEVRTLTVELTPGYGGQIVMRDARGRFDVLHPDWAGLFAASEHPPVAGVEVLADGQLAATSDERGFATFALASKPWRIEIRAPGWIVLGSNDFRNGALELGTRAAVVWLTRP